MKNTEFIRGRVPITKEEVRYISIGKMNLSRAKKMVDIGSGTGSITVEVAYRYPDISVASIETDDEAYELTKKNIEKFGIKNVVQIKAMAPVDVEGFDELDAIFLGGSKENMEKIIEWSYSHLKEGGVLVANFILLDNFFRCKEILSRVGFGDIDIVQLSVSKLEKLGRGQYFKPQNPIFIISATK